MHRELRRLIENVRKFTIFLNSIQVAYGTSLKLFCAFLVPFFVDCNILIFKELFEEGGRRIPNLVSGQISTY